VHEDQLSVLIFTLRREQGRLAELGPVVSAFLQERTVAAAWRPGLALVHLEVGQRDAARAAFEQMATAGFGAILRDGRWLFCMVYLSEVCAALGDTVRAAELYDQMLPYAGRNALCGQLVCLGSADRYLGLLCTAMSRWSEAERHFEAALAMNARIGACAPLAHTRHDFAAMLIARGDSGDRRRADALLQDSLDSARQLGMRGLEARVTALLARPSVAPAAAGPNDNDLTSREFEVPKICSPSAAATPMSRWCGISLNRGDACPQHSGQDRLRQPIEPRPTMRRGSPGQRTGLSRHHF
jgi:tetratricopeptide (TPR) repeat protein